MPNPAVMLAKPGPRSAASRLVAVWRGLRLRDKVRALAALVALGGFILAELLAACVRAFYTEHPLQAGILTGLLLALLAYSVIDAVRSNLNERRWEPLSKLAFVSLAAETTLIIDVMLWLVTTISPVNAARPSEAQQQHLLGLQASLPRPKLTDLGKVQHDDYRGRLITLLADSDWTRYALEVLDERKWRNRDGAAKWAGAMLTSPDAADVFARIAHLNELISGLQDWLRTLLGQSGYEHLSATPEEAADRWLAVHAEALSLREDLMRVSRGLPDAYVGFRRAVAQSYGQTLEKRARFAAGSSEKARRQLVLPLILPLELPASRDTGASAASK